MRVIGLTKPRGAMKVKGGRSSERSPGPIPDRVRRGRGRPIPKRGRRGGARGEFLSPVSAAGLVGARLALWSGGQPPSPVRRGAQARDLPLDAVARICCWPRRLCLGSQLACRVSLGGSLRAGRALAGSSFPSARPARFRSPILLCPAWPSARAVGKYHEQTCWDPKDGELCLARMKPEETLVEVRSNSDVQIDCQSWV